jgi:predicted ATP-grasp superfamily ATP-dependent carboligase
MVLMPCSDRWVEEVAALPAELSARFPCSQPPREAVVACLDKAAFAEQLAELDVPHARTFVIGDDDDIRRVWHGSTGDWFLKPRRSQSFQERFGAKGVLPRTLDDALRWLHDARDAGLDVVLQDFIPGPARAHCFIDGFVDRAGAVRARMARRRIRTYPAPFGDSSCMETISMDEAGPMLESLDRLLPSLRYRGIFNAQFKRDDRDGVHKLLDLNPRPWGGVSLAVACGVHLPLMSYRDALGLDVETSGGYPVGRRWVYQPRDLLACWRELGGGTWEPSDWLKTWVTSVHPVWNRSDPWPAVIFAMNEVSEKIARALRSRTSSSEAASRRPASP